MAYTICEMNGLFRVYSIKPVVAGITTFKTRKGAERFIAKATEAA